MNFIHYPQKPLMPDPHVFYIIIKYAHYFHTFNYFWHEIHRNAFSFELILLGFTAYQTLWVIHIKIHLFTYEQFYLIQCSLASVNSLNIKT